MTVVADAGMISEANQVALQAAGLSFILGARIPYLPDVVRERHTKHPDEAIPTSSQSQTDAHQSDNSSQN